MSCWDIISDYGLRSIGIGERLLPRKDFTLCHQVTLIGSGMIWNIYFGTLALLGGFFFSMALAWVFLDRLYWKTVINDEQHKLFYFITSSLP